MAWTVLLLVHRQHASVNIVTRIIKLTLKIYHRVDLYFYHVKKEVVLVIHLLMCQRMAHRRFVVVVNIQLMNISLAGLLIA